MSNYWRMVLVAAAVTAASLNAQAQEGGEGTVSEQDYGDWRVRCQQTENDEKTCIMIQQAFLKENNEMLMLVNVAYLPEQEQPAMSIVVPLGVSLAAGVKFQLGEGDESASVLGYSHCDQNGCYANLLLSDEATEQIAAVGSGFVSFMTLQGQPVDVPFSPNGFSGALESLR